MKRKVFQWFTVLLLLVCVWTAYANVLSDDTAVRAKSRITANQAAGCGDDCKLENLRGERGMFDVTTNYDILKHGHYVIVCRRAFVIAGDYACEVTEGKVAPGASSASSASPASSTTSPSSSAKK